MPYDTGEGHKEIDAHGNYAFPGVIDTHAHLNEPGWVWREDYAHGTAAAAVGGTTTLIVMPLQNNPSTVTAEFVEQKIALVAPNACVDFCLWGGIVPDNFGEIEKMNHAGCVVK